MKNNVVPHRKTRLLQAISHSDRGHVIGLLWKSFVSYFCHSRYVNSSFQQGSHNWAIKI